MHLETPETITIFKQKIRIDAAYLSFRVWKNSSFKELDKLLQLTHIRHLNAASSDLEDQHLEVIGKMETLELLDLDATEITNYGLFFLKPLHNLKQLRLKDNPQLTNGCIDYLSELGTLEMLHAGNTGITIAGFKKLLDRVRLKTLILDSEFADLIEDLLQLSAAHPGLEILVKGRASIVNGKMNN